jgi:hypothetical protein
MGQGVKCQGDRRQEVRDKDRDQEATLEDMIGGKGLIRIRIMRMRMRLPSRLLPDHPHSSHLLPMLSSVAQTL